MCWVFVCVVNCAACDVCSHSCSNEALAVIVELMVVVALVVVVMLKTVGNGSGGYTGDND